MSSETLLCHKLPAFTEADLEAVRAAFQIGPVLTLAQSWLPTPEADFLPGTVRFGWRDETFFVFAELRDADIFTRATRLNEHTWELGDAFEIFLKPVEQMAYVEFHVTPNNQRLQLRFPDSTAVEAARDRERFDEFFIDGDAMTSRLWVRPDEQQWSLLAAIPAATVWGPGRQMAEAEWQFSFSRYDYTRGRAEPVESSTSAHREPDFHCQAEWQTLRFES